MRRGRRGASLGRASALALTLTLLGSAVGCGGALVRLAEDQDWTELDRRARAQKRPPRGKGARAWAQALVALDKLDEARAVLQSDFRHGGHTASLLALAQLERERGLVGVAAAHYVRLAALDLDELQGAAEFDAICELLRTRARAEAAIGEALAADTDMRRLELICPDAITDDDRTFLAELGPAAQARAEAERSMSALAPTREALELDELQGAAELDSQLEAARTRGPRAVAGLAASADMQVTPDDVALLLAAELGGALGPGLVSRSRLAAWIGDAETDALVSAIEGLPVGAREYALLRLAGVRPDADGLSDSRQTWIVAAMAALSGQGPQESAKAWRVAAAVGDLGGAEFALNTNLRDMIPVALDEEGSSDALAPAPGPRAHWSQRVPVDRRSFDLLLTLARLFEQRGKPALALELRRSVLRAGHDVGLAQVSAVAVEEVRRQLALGHPWQALAIAEGVPGPLLDETLPAVASAVGLMRAAGLADALEASDHNVVWRSLGDAWFEIWDPRLEAALAGLDLGGGGCPSLGDWLDPAADERLRRVGLDPARSREALEAALADLGAPATGVALARALESDLALACSAPLVPLLHAGPHALTLGTLDERLIHTPELSATAQLQLLAEIALADGEDERATLLTISAAAASADPRALWARAAVAGSSYGAREYTIEALRQVLMHSDGLANAAARRELTLIRLRDVDGDEIVRSRDPKALAELARQLGDYVAEAPAQRRWARVDALLWTLAGESRADALAWELLLEVVVDEQTRRQHADAVAALERAAGAATGEDGGEDGGEDAGGGGGRVELDFLGDTEALCRAPSAAGAELSEPEQLQRLIGVASTCGPQQRAAALAALVSATPEPARSELRARILAGPLALELDPERPAVARSVAALERADSTLRVVFDLALGPAWIVDG